MHVAAAAVPAAYHSCAQLLFMCARLAIYIRVLLVYNTLYHHSLMQR